MIITKQALPRRTFLRGVGATLAIPCSMPWCCFGGLSAASLPVRRLGFVYIRWARHHRMDAEAGRPADELSPTLASLAPYLRRSTS